MLKSSLQHITGGTGLSQRAAAGSPSCWLLVPRDLISPSGLLRGHGGSFEGRKTATGTGFLPAEVSALKGQSSDQRLQIGWLLRRGKSG
eukprot:superscaffoldBa00001799_g12068